MEANAPAEEPLTPSAHFVISQEHLLHRTDENPMPTTMPPPSAGMTGAIGERHVICFIGLPARGKQYMAERLCRYLEFFHGAQCRLFDLAAPDYAGSDVRVGDDVRAYLEEEDATATRQLLRSQLEGIDDNSLDRLKKNNKFSGIAVLDSSDAFETRAHLWSGCSKESRWAMQKYLDRLRVRVKLLFIEVVVKNEDIVAKFLRQRVQLAGGLDRDSAVLATQQRIREFSRMFVSLQNVPGKDQEMTPHLRYVKLIDYGEKVVTNKIRGFLLMQIVKYLSHVHPFRRTVYLSRHGQSVYNLQQKIGGNPGLTAAGEAYAKWLGDWVPTAVWPVEADKDGESSADARASAERESARPLFGRTYPIVAGDGSVSHVPIRPARLWTSTLTRTIHTARHIPHPVLELPGRSVWHQMSPRVYRNLDEIFAGDYEGMTYDEIEARHNAECQLRKRDKLGYRYPRGESYLDLIARLDPLMHELESYSEPLLIISHQATLRVVYAYLMGRPRSEAPKFLRRRSMHRVVDL
ncbi:histidine phosphatase superfamily, partial [Pelagophyceae sp. CCMP2097]